MNELTLEGLALHLINDGLLTKDQAWQISLAAEQSKLSLINYLVKNRIVNSDALAISSATYFGLETYDLHDYDINQLDLFNISTAFIRKHRIIPLEKNHQTLKIGLSDPTNQLALDAIKVHTGCRSIPVIVSEDQLNKIIQKLFQATSDDEPLIQYVNQTIEHAIKEQASDIHIEPYQHYCRIRYRRDGMLYEIAQIPLDLASQFILRLKIMARLDISEQRFPQDGRFQYSNIDIRMNTCPTLYGEKVVLRLLSDQYFSLNLDALGFNLTQKQLFLNHIAKPHGMILVTGPTGSGKTTTLYAALNHLNTTEKNISTVEDPIEIQCNGINQVAIQPKIGLHYATILRTFLRQDPDIIMIGEIRDSETANIALQAAETGHLVLSTLHTNSAIETLFRLQSMGIEPYKMASSLSLIIAQRLLRKLCVHCKQPEQDSARILTNLHIDPSLTTTLFRAIGCKYCLNGYQGRIAVYEMLANTRDLTDAIFHERSIQHHFQTLHQSGIEKVLDGTISLTELNRVLFT